MELQRDIIVANATPHDVSGARAVVRLSGAGTFGLLGRVFGDVFEPRRGTARREIVLLGVPIPILVASFVGPGSFTGEDSAEVFLTANGRLVEALVALLCENDGVRLAGPGEFSARAYLNGRLGLDEAEGIARLIGASNELELEAARRVLSGEAGERARLCAEGVARLLALVEAGIDFTDQEDVVPISPRELVEAIGKLAHALGGAVDRQVRTGLFRAVLVGPPSAGKSTLFNALLGFERSVTDSEPGTTRDVITERLELDGVDVELCDLPGLDAEPMGVAGKAAQAAAERAIAAADLVIACDPDGRWWFVDTTRPALRVRTKLDLHGATDAPLAVCARDGAGLAALRRAIADEAIGGPASTEAQAELSVVPRHRRAFGEAVEALQAAGLLVDATARSLDEPELVAAELRLALDRLGEVTGRVTPDEVIGRVFASFCVGK
ncbi:MAG: GTPase [Planctomycetota bacterium]